MSGSGHPSIVAFPDPGVKSGTGDRLPVAGYWLLVAILRDMLPLRLAALLVLAACAQPVPPPADNPLPGRFEAEYGPATPAFEAFRAGLVSNRFLDTIATRLNDSLALPLGITLATAHCDEPNATYSPSMRRVTLCYELFRSLADRFKTAPGQEYLVPGTIMFALMHETGHALVDVLALPVTGREEDAVDQLASILLLEQGAIGDSLLFGAAVWLAGGARRGRFDTLALADDHSLDQQRVYNLICWIEGRAPGRYPQVRTEAWLPEHRRRQCPEEYAKLSASWRRLLTRFRRPHP